jgi:hypothetical protein
MSSLFRANPRRHAGAMLALSVVAGGALAAHAGVTTGVGIVGTGGQVMFRAYNDANLYATIGSAYPSTPGDTGLYTCDP